MQVRPKAVIIHGRGSDMPAGPSTAPSPAHAVWRARAGRPGPSPRLSAPTAIDIAVAAGGPGSRPHALGRRPCSGHRASLSTVTLQPASSSNARSATIWAMTETPVSARGFLGESARAAAESAGAGGAEDVERPPHKPVRRQLEELAASGSASNRQSSDDGVEYGEPRNQSCRTCGSIAHLHGEVTTLT
jgi:hypothetical protein